MKKGRLGFTLIEVSLFLAISGLLFVGVTLGVQNSIYQQRKNDSVQNFVEFLRGVYDEVTNVQNDPDGGKSEQAIYGKLVTFGETNNNLAGGPAEDNEIFVYTVIGNVSESSGNSGAISRLEKLEANVTKDKINWAGYPYSYTPKWTAQVEPACQGDDCSRNPFKGKLLIVRHPDSGVVTSYFTSDSNVSVSLGEESTNILKGFSDEKSSPQIDFCLDTDPGGADNERTDVRILKGTRNGSGIEILSRGNEGYLCGN